MTPLQNPNLIGLDQIENLPGELANQRQEVSIRLKTKAGSWPEYFSGVLVFSRQAILLTHMPTCTVTNVPDLNRVTGFEIDLPHKIFLPFERYVINPVCERLKGKRYGLRHA